MSMLRLAGRRIREETAGSVVIESAFVIPVLAILALGGFEASRIVSRQTELQTSASEAASIVLANPPDDAAQRDVIEDVIEASTGLEDDEVTLQLKYRCDSSTSLVDSASVCGSTDVISEFIMLTITDVYTPIWVDFGISGPVNYNVSRRVQVS